MNLQRFQSTHIFATYSNQTIGVHEHKLPGARWSQITLVCRANGSICPHRLILSLARIVCRHSNYALTSPYYSGRTAVLAPLPSLVVSTATNHSGINVMVGSLVLYKNMYFVQQKTKGPICLLNSLSHRIIAF